MRDTRSLVLDSARCDFATYGFDGSRVDRIARSAGVNKERIYGHFGSKENLYRAVVDDGVSNLHARVRALGSSSSPRGVCAAICSELATDLILHRILVWETARSLGVDSDLLISRSESVLSDDAVVTSFGNEGKRPTDWRPGGLLRTCVETLWSVRSSFVASGVDIDPRDLAAISCELSLQILAEVVHWSTEGARQG